MKVSSKGRYAILIMMEIASMYHTGHVSLRTMAENNGIPVKFAEQIVRLLSRDGHILSVRGSKGGYMLTKHPSRYTVGDILRTTEDTLIPFGKRSEIASHSGAAGELVELHFFTGLSEAVNVYLDSMTLEQLADLNNRIAAEGYSI